MIKFTRRTVANRLGVNVKTIDRLAARGKLRKVRLSARRVVIDPNSLREMLGENLYAELFEDSPALPRAGDKEQRGKEVAMEQSVWAVDERRVRIHQNGYGDTIVAAEIELRGRFDLVPAENWRELEPEARAYLQSRGVKASEAGTFECPSHIAARAQFGFELFWAQSGLAIGEALAEYRKRVLGEADYARFAIAHNLSPRTIELLEKRNRIPRRADTRARIERAYRLPTGFLNQIIDDGGDL